MKIDVPSRILFLVAHPYLRESRANRAVVEALDDLPGVKTHVLYDLYPYFHIDRAREMELLASHDLIVVQHPLYWYSMPALMRHWVSEVFQPGWAYGPDANELKGKDFLLSITIGGSEASYSPAGSNRFSLDTFLAPWNQIAHVCHMNWREPIVLYDTLNASDEDLKMHGQNVRSYLKNYLEGRT